MAQMYVACGMVVVAAILALWAVKDEEKQNRKRRNQRK